MESLIAAAKAHGFSHATEVDPSALVPRDEVRQMCSANLCSAYGTNWMCPPACGPLSTSTQTLRRFHEGLLVQLTAQLEDSFDYEAMMAADKLARKLVSTFLPTVRERFPKAIALGNGACDLCKTCTYPSKPCRRPTRAIQSMESFGLVVSEACEAANLPYYYGPNTITYTGCYLLR
ncbi:MAG: DUF2284 domain-containing protein [Propionibacteriaceae bacterium]|nr:DUF2284 domain-containing protein [Propionibacteriaceae bacterium]